MTPALVLTVCILSARTTENPVDSSHLDNCTRQLLCSYDFNTSSPEPWVCTADRPLGRVCSCDMDCIVYGDCCVDVFIKCFNITSTRETVRLIEATLSEVANVKDDVGFVDRYVGCVRLVPQDPQSLGRLTMSLECPRSQYPTPLPTVDRHFASQWSRGLRVGRVSQRQLRLVPRRGRYSRVGGTVAWRADVSGVCWGFQDSLILVSATSPSYLPNTYSLPGPAAVTPS